MYIKDLFISYYHGSRASPKMASQWLLKSRGLVDYTGWIAWHVANLIQKQITGVSLQIGPVHEDIDCYGFQRRR